MTYIIYKDGEEANRIVADEEFCKRYYSSDGYSYEEAPPEPEPAPEDPQYTTEDALRALIGKEAG